MPATASNGNGFPARFDGICGNCHKAIRTGQFINWNRRGERKIYHIDCQNPDFKPEPTQTDIEAIEQVIESANVPQIQTRVTVAELPPSSNPADTLTAAIQAIAGNSINAAKVEEIVNRKLATSQDNILRLISEIKQPKELVVTRVDGDARVSVNVGQAHRSFPMLVKVASAHTNETPINIWLTGPAGSGKTHAAAMLAKALGLEFGFSGAIMEPYSLLGYTDANGKLVRTQFRERYEHGGVFLQDEIDGSSPNGLLPFNAALANGHCAFPDGVIARHKDCIIIAAANTFGLGGTSDYVGRVKLDAATLSRYVFMDWDYDEELERKLAGNDTWTKRVQTIRAKTKMLGLKLLITPRATYTGAKLLKAGIPQSEVENMVLRQGMTTDQWNQIRMAN